MLFLRLYGEGRDRPRLQSGKADRFSGFLAISVSAVLDPPERLIDLRDQLSRPIPSPQLERTVRFKRCTIGNIGLLKSTFLQVLKRFRRFTKEISPPAQ